MTARWAVRAANRVLRRALRTIGALRGHLVRRFLHALRLVGMTGTEVVRKKQATVGGLLWEIILRRSLRLR